MASGEELLNQLINGADPYRPATNLLSQWRYDPVKAGDNNVGKAAAVGLGQVLLTQMLNNESRDYRADQLGALSSVYKDLYKNPATVVKPEGLNSDVFENARLFANEALANEDLLRQRVKNQAKNSVASELVRNNPDLVSDPKRAMETLAALVEGTAIPEVPAARRIEDDIVDSLSPEQKAWQQTFDFATKRGATRGQASELANTEAKRVNKKFEDNLSDISGLRQKAADLLDLSTRTAAATDQAGATGADLVTNIRQGLAGIASGLGFEDQNKKITAEKQLDALKPDTLRQNLVKGLGALSDVESRAIFGAGPSSDQTPDFNKSYAKRTELLGSRLNDYADFLEQVLEEGGSKADAEKIYADYRAAHPLVTANNEINVDAPTISKWLESQLGQGDIGETIAGYTLEELKAAGYSDSDIQQLKGGK